MNIITLENNKHKISFLNYGAGIYEWIVKKTNTNIVLTNKDLNDYKDPSKGYFGLTIGPVSNRINNGTFTLNNTKYTLEQNEKTNTLHSGLKGIWNKIFKVHTKTDNKLVYYLETNEETDGFPGDKKFFVEYTLLDDTLKVEYKVSTTEDTPINVTNHSYFNLNGKGNTLDHDLRIDSISTMEIDDELIPTGKISLSKNTFLDYKDEKKVSSFLDYKDGEFGIDNFFLFDEENTLVLSNDDTVLNITSSYPGVQIYTGNFPSKQLLNDNRSYEKYGGIAIEPHYEVDAVNNNFRDIILTKDKDYYEWTEYKISYK